MTALLLILLAALAAATVWIGRLRRQLAAARESGARERAAAPAGG